MTYKIKMNNKGEEEKIAKMQILINDDEEAPITMD
jgi:hypothetical protein